RSHASDQKPWDLSATDSCVSSTSGGISGTVDIFSSETLGRPSRIRHSRIDNGIQKVRQQLTKQGEDRKQQDQTHDRWIIELANRFEKQSAHSGPRKNLLEDNGPAKNERQFQAEHRDERNQRVAERMLYDDVCTRHTLRPGRANVILP